ncbi:MAG: hypothetical protein C5B50_02095 [Verrucomicrobia bacterium]|nr:MAG: hypothetical protein C5B50_02095 [Verrucomicrobiota bacterium]
MLIQDPKASAIPTKISTAIAAKEILFHKSGFIFLFQNQCVLYCELRMVREGMPNEAVSTEHSRRPSVAGATLTMEREINEVEGMTCNSLNTASSTTVALLPRMEAIIALILGA